MESAVVIVSLVVVAGMGMLEKSQDMMELQVADTGERMEREQLGHSRYQIEEVVYWTVHSLCLVVAYGVVVEEEVDSDHMDCTDDDY